MIKIKTIIKGEILRKEYEFNPNISTGMAILRFGDGLIEQHILYRFRHMEWRTIFEGEIDKPPFDVGEIVYINELDQEVKIAKRVRTTNGEIIYYVNECEKVEDDITQKSLYDAKMSKEEYLKAIEQKRIAEESKKVEEKYRDKNKKKWWQFWR